MLLKERTRLHGEKLMYRSRGERMPDPARLTKVRKSMGRIKQVGFMGCGLGCGERLRRSHAHQHTREGWARGWVAAGWQRWLTGSGMGRSA